jgi:hypothetical protein
MMTGEVDRDWSMLFSMEHTISQISWLLHWYALQGMFHDHSEISTMAITSLVHTVGPDTAAS